MQNKRRSFRGKQRRTAQARYEEPEAPLDRHAQNQQNKLNGTAKDRNMEYLTITHPQWPSMWDELARDQRNQGDSVCAFAGHAWEYMGSTVDHHHFRHACHPHTEKVEYAYIERAWAQTSVAWA